MVKESKQMAAVAIQVVLLSFLAGGVHTAAAAVPVPPAPDGVHLDDVPDVVPPADFVLVKKHRIEGASYKVASPPSAKACREDTILNTVRSNTAKYMPMDDYKTIGELFQGYNSCRISFQIDMPLDAGHYVQKLVRVDLSVRDGHLNGCVSVRSRFARPDDRYAVCFYPDGVTIEQD